jgi:acetylornithine deacetylase/succinyl-diaminopimelate desuccinylase-like protein
MSAEKAIKFTKQNLETARAELIDFLKIPSISTLSERKTEMTQAAEWLVKKLNAIGMENAQILATAGHPVVYADSPGVPNMPTILFYGHYDVQPADPLELWESDPFEPTIRGDNLFARGASDMKGQVVAFLEAIRAFTQTGNLPINIKFLIEGEEEIGSPSLADFIREHQSLLSADICLNADSSILAPDMPSITYALRGLAYFEIQVQGPASDLHSGTFGGVVDNPLNILASLIGKMKDETGRIALPGFYDKVTPLSDLERKDLAALPQGEQWWLQATGAPSLGGERAYTATERATARPTLDVNGIIGGFTGEGSKTVLPAEAMAKISMRLVPEQDPREVFDSLKQFMEEHTPDSVRWEIIDLAGANPAILDRDSKAVEAAAAALQKVWGSPSYFKREGGTVPVVGMIKDLINLDTLMLGFGLPDDNLHAPNEKLYLPNFARGIESYIYFIENMS